MSLQDNRLVVEMAKHELDPTEQQLDHIAPGLVGVRRIQVTRGRANPTGVDVEDSGLGCVCVQIVPPQDNRTPPQRMGYRVSLAGGALPVPDMLPNQAVRAIWNEDSGPYLVFYWKDGATNVFDPIRMTLAISGVDLGGNVGRPRCIGISDPPVPGRVMVADFSSGSCPSAALYWEHWGDSPALNGWVDTSDLQIVGDFLGLGHDQVMFINRSGVDGKVLIADFSSGRVPATTRYLERWGQSTALNGWLESGDLHLVGDFMGVGHDQVLFVNRTS